MSQIETFYKVMQRQGITRRSFMKYCSLTANALRLGPTFVPQIAHAMETKPRTPVIWVNGLECTCCSECFIRGVHPLAKDVVLSMISLDYSHVLMAAAGHAAEVALEEAMETQKGNYILACEGNPPLNEDGMYCIVGGQPFVEGLRMAAAAGAKAVIAGGACASYGCAQEASPNPTQATPIRKVITDKPIIKIPGCPRDTAGNIGAFEANLMETRMERPEEPVEILRTLHSFDPCLACSTHVMSPDGRELARVKVRQGEVEMKRLALTAAVPMLAVGLWSGFVLLARFWLGAAAFLAAMAGGAMLSWAGFGYFRVKEMILASVVAFGLLVLVARPGQSAALTVASLAIVGIFASAHGYAHASAAVGTAAGYLADFLTATEALHLSGIGIARAVATGSAARFNQRGTGVAVATGGPLMMAGRTMASFGINLSGLDAAPEDLATASRQTSVYVYEAPVRLWHWINAAAILTLCATGYFIGSP